MKALPNILTISRILAIPAIITLMLIGSDPALWAGFALFIAAAITDFLDGWLARKLQVVSPFGRFLDPIADKLLIACLLPLFCVQGVLPGLWVITVILILFREILISGLREFLAPFNVVIHVTKLAKWKTTLQLIACGILIIAPVLGDLYVTIGQYSMAAAALITAITGWDYFRQGMQHMKDIKQA